MKQVLFYRVEYDLEYFGGDYHRVGEFSFVPVDGVERLGMEKAFELWTKYSAVHIIHWSPDEVYDCFGERVEDDDVTSGEVL